MTVALGKHLLLHFSIFFFHNPFLYIKTDPFHNTGWHSRFWSSCCTTVGVYGQSNCWLGGCNTKGKLIQKVAASNQIGGFLILSQEPDGTLPDVWGQVMVLYMSKLWSNPSPWWWVFKLTLVANVSQLNSTIICAGRWYGSVQQGLHGPWRYNNLLLDCYWMELLFEILFWRFSYETPSWIWSLFYRYWGYHIFQWLWARAILEDLSRGSWRFHYDHIMMIKMIILWWLSIILW